ncbi:MAG TPA: tRNA threonylcarbamoyladenosine dehydratase [Bacillota bacterium]|nr:tRNA threonylcarbamoyladenosine dehydratase [Bacillota bacterium]HPM64544.1 tRNA threonylcarbamoyladenosine dehydratase [Bacillota bacterium]
MDANEGPFSREVLLIGEDGLARLAGSHVAVFGIGGVGSFCAEALVRAGIGEITLVDSDEVRPSNTNRQLIALSSTVGRPKAEVMAERALDINPAIKVHPKKVWFDENTADGIFSVKYDYVADAIDSVGSKLLLISTCLKNGIPMVSSMGAGNKLDASGFKIVDISKTHTCPLAKAIRVGLRKHGIHKGLEVVFSASEPMARTQGPPGSISYVPPTAGLLIAQAVITGLLKG